MELVRYGIGHFLVDFLCAWKVLGFVQEEQWIALAVVYNFCAFAMQLPIGALADRRSWGGRICVHGSVLVILGLVLRNPWASVVLVGLGNALYHVGGGRAVLCTTKGYGPLGAFVAPGAMGLFLGGLVRGKNIWGVLGAILLLVCVLPLLGIKEKLSSPKVERTGKLPVLFLVVLLRSFVAMTAQSPWKVGAFAFMAVLFTAWGKALGGLAADRLGGKMAGGLSLLGASVLFLFPTSPVLGLLALLLYQMSMPITLKDGVGAYPGTIFGLMTFGLFLGFLPGIFGVSLSSWETALLSACSGALLLWGAGRWSS